MQVLQGRKVNGAMAPAAHTASWNRLETWETRGALEETGTRQARQSENTYSTRIWLWWLQLWIRLGTAFDLTADHRLGVSNHNHNDGPSNASFGCSRWAGLHLCPFLPVAVCLRLRQCHRDRPDRLTETAADCTAGRRRRSCWSNPPPQTTEKAKIPSLVVSNRRAGICRALSPLSSALLSRVHRWFSLPFSPPFNTPRFCASLPAEARRYRLGTIRVCASRDWSVATATRRRLGLDFRAAGRGESAGQSTGFKSASAPRRPPRVLAGFARSTAPCSSSSSKVTPSPTTPRSKVATFCCFWAFPECDFWQKNTCEGSRKKGDCAASLPESDRQMQLVNHWFCFSAMLLVRNATAPSLYMSFDLITSLLVLLDRRNEVTRLREH